MRILIVLRKFDDDSGKIAIDIKNKLEESGHKVEILSREDELHITSLSASMGTLKEFIKVKDDKEKYDIIYTQDWSIAFPLLIPKRVFEKKHFSFFHDIQEGDSSKIFQKIVGNMLGENLIVRTDELKKMFPKSILDPEGIQMIKKIGFGKNSK